MLCRASRRTTVARLGRQIASGRPITPQGALRTLAQQTARTISNPRALAQTYRRSLALDRRYHQRTRRVLVDRAARRARANGDSGSAMGGPAMGGPDLGGPAMGGPAMGVSRQMGGLRWPAIPTGAVPSAGGRALAVATSLGCRASYACDVADPVPSCPNCGR